MVFWIALVFMLAAASLLLLDLVLARRLPWGRLRQKRARILEQVVAVLRKAGRFLKLQEVLDEVTRVTVEVTGVRGCSIKLWDPKAGRMRVRSTAGIERPQADLSIDVAVNLYHRSLMEGSAVTVGEALSQDFPEVDDQVESLICVPLRKEQQVLGALCVYGRKGERLSKDMIDLLTLLGDLVTLSIANASLYEDLKKLDEAKSWFLLKASHELRSPLATLQSMTRTLHQGYLGELEEPQRQLLERIELRMKLLNDSVSDLLTLAKGKAALSSSEVGRIDLCAILSENARFFEAQAREKGVSLDLSCTAGQTGAYGTTENYHTILTNLLSNAVKYTPSGGKILLSLEEEGGDLVLTVKDTGIGIPLEEQPLLFREFFRASNARSLSETGTGLGLAIVKSTVEQMDGRLEVDSAPGRGTSFRIRFRKITG